MLGRRQLTELRVQIHKDILRNLLRRSPVARNPQRNRKHHVLVFAQQRREVFSVQAGLKCLSLAYTQPEPLRNAKSFTSIEDVLWSGVKTLRLAMGATNAGAPGLASET
jgi:hypothetical protein